MPLSAAEYRADLRRQAQDSAIRKAAANAHEASLDRQVCCDTLIPV